MMGEDEKNVANGFVDTVGARHHRPSIVISFRGFGFLQRIEHTGAKKAAAKTRLNRHAAQVFFRFRGLLLLSGE